MMSLKGAKYPVPVDKELGIVMYRDGSKYKIVYDLCSRKMKDGRHHMVKLGRLEKCAP